MHPFPDSPISRKVWLPFDSKWWQTTKPALFVRRPQTSVPMEWASTNWKLDKPRTPFVCCVLATWVTYDQQNIWCMFTHFHRIPVCSGSHLFQVPIFKHAHVCNIGYQHPKVPTKTAEKATGLPHSAGSGRQVGVLFDRHFFSWEIPCGG